MKMGWSKLNGSSGVAALMVEEDRVDTSGSAKHALVRRVAMKRLRREEIRVGMNKGIVLKILLREIGSLFVAPFLVKSSCLLFKRV